MISSSKPISLQQQKTQIATYALLLSPMRLFMSTPTYSAIRSDKYIYYDMGAETF